MRGDMWALLPLLLLLASPLPTACRRKEREGQLQTDQESVDITSAPLPYLDRFNQSIQYRPLSDGVKRAILRNGLTVLLKEDRTAPVVAVQMWYHLGSRYETKENSGLSHMLEHMLFQGTKKRPIQFGKLFYALAATSNAFTLQYQTVYHSTAPKDTVRTLLQLEADRMQHSLLEDRAMEKEKQVVMAELQGDEDSPATRLDQAMMKAAFPDSWAALPIGGSKASVYNFSTSELVDLYRKHYQPACATLVLVGDLEWIPMLKIVQQQFETIGVPKGQSKTRVSSSRACPSKFKPSENTGQLSWHNFHPPSEVQVQLNEIGGTPLLHFLYPIPHINHADIPALRVLDTILTHGHTSRLYEVLVQGGLVASVEAEMEALPELGWYRIFLKVSPDQEIKAALKEFDQQVHELQQDGVSLVELKQAKHKMMVSLLMDIQDISSQASHLAFDEQISGRFNYTDIFTNMLATVTAEDVKAVANRYLSFERRTVGSFQPVDRPKLNFQTHLASASNNVAVKIPPILGTNRSSLTEQFLSNDNFPQPQPLPAAGVESHLVGKMDMRTVDELTWKGKVQHFQMLNNGLRVYYVQSNSSSVLVAHGHVLAGAECDPGKAYAGVAWVLAEYLNGLKAVQNLEEGGARVEFSADKEWLTFTAKALNGDLNLLIKTISSVLTAAPMNDMEIENSKQQVLADLGDFHSDPMYMSKELLMQSLYQEEHAFHRRVTEYTISRITPQHVKEFYETYLKPQRTVLVFVGNFHGRLLQSHVENSLLGFWKTAHSWEAEEKGIIKTYDQMACVPLQLSMFQMPRPQTRLLKQTLPGLSDNSDCSIAIGNLALDRRDINYYPALILNQVVGGDTLSSRLGMQIREEKGLTYGVHSFLDAGMHIGTFHVRLQTAAGQRTADAIQIVLQVLQDIRYSGISDAEVELAKHYIIGSTAVSLTDHNYLASTLASQAIFDLPIDELVQMPSKVNSVTKKEVNAVAKLLLDPKHLQISVTCKHFDNFPDMQSFMQSNASEVPPATVTSEIGTTNKQPAAAIQMTAIPSEVASQTASVNASHVPWLGEVSVLHNMSLLGDVTSSRWLRSSSLAVKEDEDVDWST